MLLLAIISFSLTNTATRCATVTRTPFTFDDIYSAQYRPKIFKLDWIKGTESFLYRDEANDFVKFNAETDTQETFLPSSLFVEMKAEKYFLSSDLKLVLFAYHVKQTWRHSFTAKYLIVDLETRNRYYFPNGHLQNETLSHVAWSPTGHSLVFVYKSNVYVQSSPTSPARQISFDGNSTVTNGIPDWLYEEEILEDASAAGWSPDGRFLYYSRFDVTEVLRQHLIYYGKSDNLYGRLRSIHYPKAGFVVNGEPGPTTQVKLFVADVAGGNGTFRLSPPPFLLGRNHYYINAGWRDSTHILVTWTNRVQNESVTILYDVNNPSEMTEVLTTSESNGWIDLPHPKPWFVDGGKKYLTIHSHKPSNRKQLAVVTCEKNVKDKIVFLTNGEEVESIVGFNEKEKYIYYITLYHSKGRQLWRIHAPSLTSSQNRVECMHCQSDLDYVEAFFSSSGENYLVKILGPDVPQFFLKSTVEGREYKSVILEDNSLLKKKLREKVLPEKQYFQYQNGDGSVGLGQMIVPNDPGTDESFPMLVFTYAGPNTQAVTTKFMLERPLDNWLVHLASEHRILVVTTDGRGSNAGGESMKFAIFHKMGSVEVEDQMLGAEHVKKNSGLKVAPRSAIFGWSYGGFVAAHALANNNNTFMCGVSVAPTTNQGLYDTAYSERYLGLITDPGGIGIYNRTNLMNKAEYFRRKKFFIAQGLADDNVHYNHFAQLVRELQKHLILFRQSTYPDEKHDIATTDVNKHLFLSITDFLLNDCWSTGWNYQESLETNKSSKTLYQFIHELVKTLIPF